MAGPSDMTFIYLLGGTILSLAGKADPADSAALLRTAGIHLDGPVTVRPFRSVGSQNLTLADIRALAADITARHGEGVRAFVVAQGTDTMEESSFLLSLLAPATATIIMTGSMRTADAPGAEGPGNLRDALIAARSLSGHRPGVLVAVAGELHDARLVRKMDSGRIAAFGSPGWGPVGSIITGRVRLAMTPLSAPGPYDWPADCAAARVGLLTVAMDGDPLSALPYADAAWAGLVVEAMGSGHVPQALAAPLAAIAAAKPLLLVSRCPQGDTDGHGTYQGDGTAAWLMANGLIDAGSLDARKARLLLTVLLGAGRDVRAAMAGWAGLGVV